MIPKENIDKFFCFIQCGGKFEKLKGGQIMPTYDYQCRDCKRNFSVKHSIAEYGKAKVDCPKCKSKKVKQQISLFIIKTSRKS